MALSLGRRMSFTANGKIITQRLKAILISRITVNFLSPQLDPYIREQRKKKLRGLISKETVVLHQWESVAG